ncbi:MAG: lytic transglycosylase domain-containing protein [Chitinophagaceae bacterium]|nr:lytic transglycosylase domain-containing protein [Oligoflexus sp.]
MTLRLGHLCAALLVSGSLAFTLPLQAKEPEAYETMLKKALRTIKDEQQEKLRNTLSGLTEQVQGEVEPAKRMQAAILLAAHYWETNYRLSRYYLGIAEALKDPTIPEFNRYDAEIEHMKIRFRHAALLDEETKKEIESQLAKNPEEPIRHSLVEMLLETDQALAKDDDYLAAYKKFYSAYPRAIRKDRFIKKAALIYTVKSDDEKATRALEVLLDQYPASEEAIWALDELMKAAKVSGPMQYSFTYGLMKKVYRNSSHDKVQQEKVLALLATALRKTSDAKPAMLDLTEKVRVLCYLGLLEDALKLAQTSTAKPDLTPEDKQTLQAWIGYIYSEKGEHALALQTFALVPAQTSSNIMFKEAQAKSMMNSQKFAEASTAYLSLLKRSNNNYRYRWYYFWNLLAGGDVKAAGQYMLTSKDKAFNEVDFRKDAGLYWEGRTLLSSGKIAAAVDVLKPLLGKSVPGYYTMSARAAITNAQAVQAKKKSSLSPEGDQKSGDLGSHAVFASYHPKNLKEDKIERSDRIPFASYVHEISHDMDIDPYLILSIMRSESGFNSRALSQAGAQGLMQLMPYTAIRLSRLFEDPDFKLDQLQTPDTNVLYGSLYLSLLLHYYGGHEIPAVAAYNAGPTMVNKWLKECQGCPNDAFVEFIPYAETRNYVKKVMSTFTAFRLQETQSPPDFMQKKLPTTLPDTENIF